LPKAHHKSVWGFKKPGRGESPAGFPGGGLKTRLPLEKRGVWGGGIHQGNV